MFGSITHHLSFPQVKNFGRSGRTKYTHLVDQDTTSFDSAWGQESAQNTKFFKQKAAGVRDVFERPSAKKRKTTWKFNFFFQLWDTRENLSFGPWFVFTIIYMSPVPSLLDLLHPCDTEQPSLWRCFVRFGLMLRNPQKSTIQIGFRGSPLKTISEIS